MESMLEMMGLKPEDLIKQLLESALTEPKKFTLNIEEMNKKLEVIVYRTKSKKEDADYYYCIGIKPLPKEKINEG